MLATRFEAGGNVCDIEIGLKSKYGDKTLRINDAQKTDTEKSASLTKISTV